MALDHLWALMVLSDADQYFLYEAIERNTVSLFTALIAK